MSAFEEYRRRRASAPSLADAAIAIAATGLPVFPCGANKRPLTEHGFKDASTDETTIRRWFADPAAVMIGMPTGRASGLVVVDVDIKDGRQGMDWLNANSHRLPQTRTIRTGSGGLHLYLRHWGEVVRNSASRIAPGIDVRGDGGYVIVVPSPNYVVADAAEPAEADGWLRALLCPPEPALAPRPAPRARDAVPDAYAEVALREELDRAASAPDGTRNHTIHEVAVKLGTLVGAGLLPRGLVEAELGAIAAQWPNRPKTLDTIKRGIDYGQAHPRDLPEREPTPVAEDVHPAAPFLARLAAMQRAKPSVEAAEPIPVDIMSPGGVLQMLVDASVRTAIRPQPFLALGAAICAVGVLAGRKYRTSTDLRTNIYAAAVAESGGGKDHAPEIIRRCFDAAKLDRYLGGETIASGRAVLSSLEQHPARLFMVDEFGMFLTTVTGGKAAPHRAEIWSELMKLFSRAKGIYRGTEYANKKEAPRIDINQPCACFYGTTTPSTFWSALEGGALTDGSLARFLVFVTDNDRPDRNEGAGIFTPSQDLLDALKAIVRGQGDALPPGNLPGGAFVAAMTAMDEPDPYTVPMAAGAERLHRQRQAGEDEWARKVAGTLQAAIVNRLGENAAKLALISAISRDPAHPEIAERDVEWAWLLAEHCTRTLLKDAGRFMADSDYERKVNRLVEIITKHGPISDAMIYNRHSFRLPARERADMLRDLVQVGVLVAIQADPDRPGPKPIRYAIATKDPADAGSVEIDPGMEPSP